MLKTGLVSVSFREHSPEEIINACHAAGLKYTEWGSDVHARYDDTNTLRRISALQKEYGVMCSSYGTYFRIGRDPSKEIYGYIKAAEILGTDTLRVWCGTKASSEYSEDEKEKLMCDVRKLSEISAKEGVKLCTEFHHGTYTDTSESVLSVLKEAGSESFKTYWQPNQFRTFEENLKSAEALAPYTENIHVFNWSAEKKYPLINAKETWYKYFECFSGEHFALLEFMPDGRIESLFDEASALKGIIGI